MSYSDHQPGIQNILQSTDPKSVSSKCESYMEYYNPSSDQDSLNKKRREESVTMTQKYFDIATDFYEYGWGESFHFAPLRIGEPMALSLAKHEYRVALKLGLKSGMKVADLGCGVGGPARHLAEISGAHITCLNSNSYQIERCKLLTEQAGLTKLCSFVHGDFCDTPFTDESFDAAYGIEAICHASDRKDPFREIKRILKPGSMFAMYDWIMTKKYDPENPEHNKIRNDIMTGNSLPHITGIDSILDDLRSTGFEIVEEYDLAETGGVPWWTPLAPMWTLTGIRSTWLGRWMTHLMLVVLQAVGWAPRGSLDVHRMLCVGADGLWKGGKMGIFTTIHFILARKPNK